MAIVIAAIAGPQWLFTEEKLPNANYNGTANFNALDDGVYVTKYTKSSLWILCTTGPGECETKCKNMPWKWKMKTNVMILRIRHVGQARLLMRRGA